MIVLTWRGSETQTPVYYFAGGERSWTDNLKNARKFDDVRALAEYLCREGHGRAWFYDLSNIIELYEVTTKETFVLGPKLA
jgi:hypothetical protein